MKYQLIITAILGLLSLSMTANAQFNASISVGPSFSSVAYASPDLISRTKPGFFVSVAPGYQLTDFVGFNLGVQYITKQFEDDPENVVGSFAYKNSHLEFVPEIELSLLDFITLGVGVNYGFKLKEEINSNNTGWMNSNDTPLFKNSNFGISGKLQGEINNLLIFVRYTHGLKNISDIERTDNMGNAIENQGQFSRTFQAGIGYRIVFE